MDETTAPFIEEEHIEDYPFKPEGFNGEQDDHLRLWDDIEHSEVEIG